MGKQIAVGWVRSRSDGQLLEQMLRDRGVPAFSELGVAMSEFADSAASRIYVDSESLGPEAVAVIRDVLGNDADEAVLAQFETVTAHKEVVMARIADEDEAKYFFETLRSRDVPVFLENLASGEVALLIREHDLTPERAKAAVAFLGDAADEAVRDLAGS